MEKEEKVELYRQGRKSKNAIALPESKF